MNARRSPGVHTFVHRCQIARSNARSQERSLIGSHIAVDIAIRYAIHISVRYAVHNLIRYAVHIAVHILVRYAIHISVRYAAHNLVRYAVHILVRYAVHIAIRYAVPIAVHILVRFLCRFLVRFLLFFFLRTGTICCCGGWMCACSAESCVIRCRRSNRTRCTHLPTRETLTEPFSIFAFCDARPKNEATYAHPYFVWARAELQKRNGSSRNIITEK